MSDYVHYLFGSMLDYASAEYWIHFTARYGDVYVVGYNSAESEPIWMKSGALWVRGLALADFGHDPGCCESWRAARIFFQVNNAWLHRFSVGQISQNLNTTRRSVSR